jgi:hypothetical protein
MSRWLLLVHVLRHAINLRVRIGGACGSGCPRREQSV